MSGLNYCLEDMFLIKEDILELETEIFVIQENIISIEEEISDINIISEYVDKYISESADTNKESLMKRFISGTKKLLMSIIKWIWKILSMPVKFLIRLFSKKKSRGEKKSGPNPDAKYMNKKYSSPSDVTEEDIVEFMEDLENSKEDNEELIEDIEEILGADFSKMRKENKTKFQEIFEKNKDVLKKNINDSFRPTDRLTIKLDSGFRVNNESNGRVFLDKIINNFKDAPLSRVIKSMYDAQKKRNPIFVLDVVDKGKMVDNLMKDMNSSKTIDEVMEGIFAASNKYMEMISLEKIMGKGNIKEMCKLMMKRVPGLTMMFSEEIDKLGAEFQNSFFYPKIGFDSLAKNLVKMATDLNKRNSELIQLVKELNILFERLPQDKEIIYKEESSKLDTFIGMVDDFGGSNIIKSLAIKNFDSNMKVSQLDKINFHFDSSNITKKDILDLKRNFDGLTKIFDIVESWDKNLDSDEHDIESLTISESTIEKVVRYDKRYVNNIIVPMMRNIQEHVLSYVEFVQILYSISNIIFVNVTNTISLFEILCVGQSHALIHLAKITKKEFYDLYNK